MTAVPRLVVSAPSSGHGKTAVAVGLLAAFAGSGLRATGFKVGPDHTDAAYLGLAAGRVGRNLDPRLVGPQRIAPLFAHGAAGADIAVVEGTMGLFDSLAGRSEADSTAGVAGLLRAPVVLVIDVAAMGQSVAALVHGFRAYDEVLWLGGVVLNRVASDRHEQMLREALDEIGVPVLGCLRRGELAGGPSALPPRSQGVVPVLHRTVEAHRAVRRLGETVAAAVDLDRLLSLARSAPRMSVEPWSAADEVGRVGFPGRRPVIALTGADGMAYGYAETAELLTAAGAEIVAVDPLRDETLPPDADALVVCGGLPESYAEELSANARLRSAVADLALSGRPVLAEGTGLLWLAREYDGRPMCGVLDATGVPTDRMVVGYREATARASSALAPQGARVVGYKHHRSSLNPRAGSTPAWSWSGGSPEGFVWRRVHASFLTLHWAGAPEIAPRLAATAAPAAQGTGPMPQQAPAPQGAGPTVRGPMPVPPGASPAPVPAQAGHPVGVPVVPGSPSGVPVVPGSPGAVSMPPGSPAAGVAAAPPAHAALPTQPTHGEAGFAQHAHGEVGFPRPAHAQPDHDQGPSGSHELAGPPRSVHTAEAAQPSASGGYGDPPPPGSMDDTDATLTALKGPTRANPTMPAIGNGEFPASPSGAFAPVAPAPSAAQSSPAGAGGDPFMPGRDPFAPDADPFERSLGERLAAAGPDPFMTPGDSYAADPYAASVAPFPQAGSAADFGERVHVEYRGDAAEARAAADAGQYPPVAGDHGGASR
jgi:cobyrinic acid a,c-diamide synthase